MVNEEKEVEDTMKEEKGVMGMLEEERHVESTERTTWQNLGVFLSNLNARLASVSLLLVPRGPNTLLGNPLKNLRGPLEPPMPWNPKSSYVGPL